MAQRPLAAWYYSVACLNQTGNLPNIIFSHLVNSIIWLHSLRLLLVYNLRLNSRPCSESYSETALYLLPKTLQSVTASPTCTF
jgi:hypothetical protein